MNMRCRSPSRGTTNSHTGNSTSTSLCTTSIILICVSKGRGRGRGPVVPCVVGYPSPSRRCGSLPCGSMCCWLSLPQPPFATARGLAWGGGAYRAERRQLRGAWGGGLRRGHAARYRDIYIYIYNSLAPQSFCPGCLVCEMHPRDVCYPRISLMQAVNAGALIIRLGFGGSLYYNCHKEPPK